jgi:hypothetical protein
MIVSVEVGIKIMHLLFRLSVLSNFRIYLRRSVCVPIISFCDDEDMCKILRILLSNKSAYCIVQSPISFISLDLVDVLN